MPLDKSNESAMKWVRKMAMESGFTEDEIKNCTLDGFGDKTHSKRIMRLVELAYYKGWMRGIKTSEEAHSSIIAPSLGVQ